MIAVVTASYRGGSTYAPLYETFVILPIIAAMTAGCVLIAIHLRRRGRARKPVRDHYSALGVMGELCPHGWQAQITVYGAGATVPEDAPVARRPLVELEWKQYDEQPGRVAVARRAWAPTISDALEAMVEGRRTDQTLEEIEQAGLEQARRRAD